MPVNGLDGIVVLWDFILQNPTGRSTDIPQTVPLYQGIALHDAQLCLLLGGDALQNTQCEFSLLSGLNDLAGDRGNGVIPYICDVIHIQVVVDVAFHLLQVLQ